MGGAGCGVYPSHCSKCSEDVKYAVELTYELKRMEDKHTFYKAWACSREHLKEQPEELYFHRHEKPLKRLEIRVYEINDEGIEELIARTQPECRVTRKIKWHVYEPNDEGVMEFRYIKEKMCLMKQCWIINLSKELSDILE